MMDLSALAAPGTDLALRLLAYGDLGLAVLFLLGAMLWMVGWEGQSKRGRG